MKDVLHIIYKSFKSKTLFIKEDTLCKLALAGLLMVAVIGVGAVDVISALSHNILGVFIALAVCLQYKSNTIIDSIVGSKADYCRVCGQNVFYRYCLIQIIKYNYIFVPSVMTTMLTIIVLLFVDVKASVMVLVSLLINILFYYFNIKYLQAIKYNKKSQWTHLSVKNFGRIYSNLAYILRLPLESYGIMLFEMAVAIVYARLGFKMSFINYALILLLILEIETIQDANLKNFDKIYGKFAVKEISGMNKLDRFIFSEEFRIFLKFVIIEIILLYKKDISAVAYSVLFLAIAYRYYVGFSLVIRERRGIKIDIFRLVMVYLIIFALSPELFSKYIKEAYWDYDKYCSCILSLGMSLVIFLIPLERLVKIRGKEID